MLLDFPAQKRIVCEQLIESLKQAEMARLSPFSQSPRFVHHEGNAWGLHREDDTTDDSAYAEAASTLTLSRSRIPDMSPQELGEILSRLAEDLAQQQFKYHLGKISEAAAKVGHDLDARGRELSAELLLDALDVISLTFDKNGDPIMPSLVVHPDTGTKLKDKIAEWNNNPGYRERFQAIISRKREEWRDREASRKLVE